MAPIPTKSTNEVWKDYVESNRPIEAAIIEEGADAHVPDLKKNVRDYIKQGVYIAACGLTRMNQQDTWNLHFNSEPYFLFQKLIGNLLFKAPLEAKGCFSAGGDGVYRFATVLSDRFAAASMCGGHPGSSVLSNLANVPVCPQVGQWDGDEIPKEEAPRNVDTAKSAMELRRLQSYDHGYYIHDIFLHPTPFHPEGKNGRSHNSWQADHLTTAPRRVIREWDQIRLWHDERMRNAPDDKLVLELKFTCAVDWVSQRDRNPLPHFVTWDLSPQKPDEPEPILPTEWADYRFSYWLAVKAATAQEKFTALKNSGITDPNLVIRAFYNPEWNVVWSQQTPIPVIILLNDQIIKDFTKPITIFYGWLREKKVQVTVAQDYLVQSRTLYARGDPDFVFSTTIVFDPVGLTATDGRSQVFPEPSRL
ncbi:hypothetical protein JMJ35_007835 [Cladonia borealis]|uniref:Uncharacterized protein n=1 Tax=Cladonia borealis TaxID=184061 RepID=A0AA39U7D8_9LECA|nr:hypothetical protein JMJ35_007835 [Cladonia borealis]